MSYSIAFTLIAFALVIGALIALVIYQRGRKLAPATMTGAEVTASEDYQRLSERAIAAEERADQKLAEITMQLAQLHDQLDQVQKVLKDVE